LVVARYNPDKHHRRSIRLKGYDYSQSASYFVTMCTQNREHFFGKVEAGVNRLNAAGVMVEKWWRELANKFPAVEPADFVVMPNHVHGIIIIEDDLHDNFSGAILRDRPESGEVHRLGETHRSAPTHGSGRADEPGETHRSAPTHGPNPTLGEVIQWFKTMTTNEYIRGVKKQGWVRFPGRLWQRNYFERIIRDEQEYYAVCRYIAHNPERWSLDRHNRSVTEQDPRGH
jgi:putative transposase